MKKTLTVNLNGKVYHIDEDAFQMLDSYLKNLQNCFRHEEGGEEIVADMESRISELFSESLIDDATVVNIALVQDVIKRMGDPEEVSGHETEDENEQNKTTSTTVPPFLAYASKRLYRSTSDCMLGGVAGGIAAYLNIESLWVRLLFVVSMFISFGITSLVYFILWFLVPQAETATEKLRMRGEAVNLSNIGKTVTDAFVTRKNEDKHSTLLGQFFNNLFKIFAVLMKVALIFLGIVLLPFLLAMLLVVAGLFLAAVGAVASVPVFLYEVFPYIEWEEIQGHPSLAFFICLCAVVIVLIPVFVAIKVMIKMSGKGKSMTLGTKLALLFTWLAAWMIGFVLCFNFFAITQKDWDSYYDRVQEEVNQEVVVGDWDEEKGFVERTDTTLKSDTVKKEISAKDSLQKKK